MHDPLNHTTGSLCLYPTQLLTSIEGISFHGDPQGLRLLCLGCFRSFPGPFHPQDCSSSVLLGCPWEHIYQFPSLYLCPLLPGQNGLTMASGDEEPQGEWALSSGFCFEEASVVSAPRADDQVGAVGVGVGAEEEGGGDGLSVPSLSSCLSTAVPKVRSLDLSISLKHTAPGCHKPLDSLVSPLL